MLWREWIFRDPEMVRRPPTLLLPDWPTVFSTCPTRCFIVPWRLPSRHADRLAGRLVSDWKEFLICEARHRPPTLPKGKECRSWHHPLCKQISTPGTSLHSRVPMHFYANTFGSPGSLPSSVLRPSFIHPAVPLALAIPLLPGTDHPKNVTLGY